MDGTYTSVEPETKALQEKLLKHQHSLLLTVLNRGIESRSGTLLLTEKSRCTYSVDVLRLLEIKTTTDENQ